MEKTKHGLIWSEVDSLPVVDMSGYLQAQGCLCIDSHKSIYHMSSCSIHPLSSNLHHTCQNLSEKKHKNIFVNQWDNQELHLCSWCQANGTSGG